MSSQVLSIRGMTCAACSGRIEKVVRRLPGISLANVNLASEKLFVEYDEKELPLEKIKEAVTKIGYQVVEKKVARDEDRARKQKEIRTLWTKFIVSAVFSLPLLYVAMVPMINAVQLPFPGGIDPMKFPMYYAIVELILVIPVIGVGYRFYTVGYKALIHRSPNMDSLIAIGTSAAVVYSAYNVVQIWNGNFAAVQALYFETAGVIITLILLGKSLEAVSKGRTSEAIKKLMGLAPKTAIVVRGGAEKEIPIDEVEIGDMLVVKPGAKIPVDGTIMEGHTAIDESMLTGESMPVDKKAGDMVYAASLNT
ncbi:MAG: HAD-IC family P-type ATPase, partial [Clostridiales Family XIII bacterium]|nr:HAD-IC family P-type ATPase [Clostridiales Family XIII bacterium]